MTHQNPDLPPGEDRRDAQPSCSACAKLMDQERRALAVYDHSQAVDCRVLLARHRRAKHGFKD
ncbi:hypothetical protein AB0J21_09860 [Streptomyces sp. NPDC049954]|uniref:hypothetical protein n=1 Tax=Streptomyces sp. NPDC049954 TaxID=3155779 RepID=UPI003425F5B7